MCEEVDVVIDMISMFNEKPVRTANVLRSLFMMALVLNPGSQLFAHHGSAPHFDFDDLVTLEGVVTEMHFVNPHSWVHLDVVDSDGLTTSWRCELAGAIQLTRRGWYPDTLAAGHSVRIVGARARREGNACAMETMTLSDGREVLAGGRIEGEAAPAPIVASAAEVSSRPLYLPNGQPNISGSWVTRSASPIGDVPSEPPALTAAGQAASEDFDFNFDNPVLFCESGNIVSDWSRQSQINEIQQGYDQITIRYGYLDLVRTIHLDITNHPDDLAPSIAGHSIGRWAPYLPWTDEKNVLIVDTVGFLERPLIGMADIMISEQAHIVESFYFNEEYGTLIRGYTVYDPLYLARPFGGANIADVAADQYQPYDCVDLSGENNRRSAE